MVEWMGYPLYYAFDGATPPPRAGAAHATIYPYGPFPAGDGKTVMLGLQNEREWVRVLPAGAAPARAGGRRALRVELAPRRRSAQALRAIIVEAFAALTAEQVVARLDEAQIANARMNDMHDVWKHPQLKARGRWTEVGTPTGPVPALLPPGDTDAFAPRMDAVPGARTAHRRRSSPSSAGAAPTSPRCAAQARSDIEAQETPHESHSPRSAAAPHSRWPPRPPCHRAARIGAGLPQQADHAGRAVRGRRPDRRRRAHARRGDDEDAEPDGRHREQDRRRRHASPPPTRRAPRPTATPS